MKSGRGIASPFVEVEIVGAPYDNFKFKTETKRKLPFLPISFVRLCNKNQRTFSTKDSKNESVSLSFFFFFESRVISL